MRHVSPWLPGRDRPRPPQAGVVQQWQCSRQGRRRQRGKRQLSGRSSCCLPANLMAVTGNRVGKTTLFFWQRSTNDSVDKDTSKSSTTAPPVLATSHEGRRRVQRNTASRSHPGQRQGDARDTRAKRAPLTEQTRPGDARGLPQHNAQQACPTTTSTTRPRYQQEAV